MYNMVVPFIFTLHELWGVNESWWGKILEDETRRDETWSRQGNVEFQMSECHTLTVARMKQSPQKDPDYVTLNEAIAWDKMREDGPVGMSQDHKSNWKRRLCRTWGKWFKWSTRSGDDEGRRDEMMRTTWNKTWEVGMRHWDGDGRHRRWWPHFTSETSQSSVPYFFTSQVPKKCHTRPSYLSLASHPPRDRIQNLPSTSHKELLVTNLCRTTAKFSTTQKQNCLSTALEWPAQAPNSHKKYL